MALFDTFDGPDGEEIRNRPGWVGSSTGPQSVTNGVGGLRATATSTVTGSGMLLHDTASLSHFCEVVVGADMLPSYTGRIALVKGTTESVGMHSQYFALAYADATARLYLLAYATTIASTPLTLTPGDVVRLEAQMNESNTEVELTAKVNNVTVIGPITSTQFLANTCAGLRTQSTRVHDPLIDSARIDALTTAAPPPSTGLKSIRVDSASLIPGAIVCGDRGLGVLGSTVLLTTGGGTDGNGVLFNDVEAGDEAKEFRAYIVTAPVAGELYMDEDGTFTYAGGNSSFDYQLIVDGQIIGSPARVTLYEPSVATPVTVQGQALFIDTVYPSATVSVARLVSGQAMFIDSGYSNGTIQPFPRVQGEPMALDRFASDAEIFTQVTVQGQPSALDTSITEAGVSVATLVQGQPSGLDREISSAAVTPAVLVQGGASDFWNTSTDAAITPATIVQGQGMAFDTGITNATVAATVVQSVYVQGRPSFIDTLQQDARVFIKGDTPAVFKAEYDSEAF